MTAIHIRFGFVLVVALLGVTTHGCNKRGSTPNAPGAASATTVAVVKPERKTVRRVIEQPGHVQAFEQAPLLVRLPGYVSKVHVDIGDPVKVNQVLAELAVPEMDEELKQKEALVAQAKAEVGQMQAAHRAATANVETAKAMVGEAEAGRRRAQANYDRWESEYGRVEKLVASKVIDEQTRDEIRNQFKSSEAAREEVEAKVRSAKAARDESAARQEKAEADIRAAEARLQVAEADNRRLAAMLQYAKVKAPFAGIITRRTIDVGHFLQPATGTQAEPLFVVASTDKVRIFVDVPETEAALVHVGMKAGIRVQAMKGPEVSGKVMRTSWALDPKSRALRTEIQTMVDPKIKPDPAGLPRPGMYAYVTLTMEHPNVLTLPSSAVGTHGEQAYCFRVESGKAVRTPLQIGLSGSGLVEVLQKQTAPGEWKTFSGNEEIIAGNINALVDGQPVSATTSAR